MLLLSLSRHCYLSYPVVPLQLPTHHQLRRHHSLDNTRHRRERYHGRLGELPDTARTLLAQHHEDPPVRNIYSDGLQAGLDHHIVPAHEAVEQVERIFLKLERRRSGISKVSWILHQFGPLLHNFASALSA